MEELIFYLLQGLFEFVVQLYAHTDPKERHPFIIALVYLLWGMAIGIVSLFIFKVAFVASPALRVLNLWVTPVVVGYAMMRYGKWREAQQKPVIRLCQFWNTYLFLFGISLIRLAAKP